MHSRTGNSYILGLKHEQRFHWHTCEICCYTSDCLKYHCIVSYIRSSVCYQTSYKVMTSISGIIQNTSIKTTEILLLRDPPTGRINILPAASAYVALSAHCVTVISRSISIILLIETKRSTWQVSGNFFQWVCIFISH